MEVSKKQVKKLYFFIALCILMLVMAIPTHSNAYYNYRKVYLGGYSGENYSIQSVAGIQRMKVSYERPNLNSGAGEIEIHKTAYCLNPSKLRPDRVNGTMYEVQSYNSGVSTSIHAILSAGIANYGGSFSSVSEYDMSGHLNAFIASTGIYIDYYTLEQATQIAIWKASGYSAGSSYGSYSQYSTLASAVDVLSNLSGFPVVYITGNSSENYTEYSDYRVYGPYTAKHTGIVKNGTITLTGQNGAKLLRDVNGVDNNTLTVSNNTTFYIKLYKNSSYDNKRITVAKAQINYYVADYTYNTAANVSSNKGAATTHTNTQPGWVYKKGQGYVWSNGGNYTSPAYDYRDFQPLIIFEGDGEDSDEDYVSVTYIPSKGSLEVTKQDNKGGNLAGATFELTTSVAKGLAEAKVQNATVISKTDTTLRFQMTSATSTISDLELGEYTLTEVVAPSDEYIMDSEPVNFTLSSTNNLHKVTKVNIKKATLELIKQDGTGTGLSGATFSLVGNTSEAKVEGADVLSNDGRTMTFKMTSSKAIIKCLAFDTYTLKEIQAPSDEYTMDSTVATIKLTQANNIYAVTKTNFKKGKFNFYKVDENGKNLVGAQFELKPNVELTQENIDEIIKYAKNVKDLKWDATNKVFTFTNTADDSTITTEGPNGSTVIATQISHLPQGSYTIRETKAAEGYIKEEKSMTITVTNDGKAGFKLGTLILSTKAMGYTNTKIALDLGLEKWVSKVEDATSEDKAKNYVDRNTYDDEIEKRSGNIYVKEGDIVTYTIRIFNHGNVDATATKIVDNVPAGLEFIADNETNQKYGWEIAEDGKVYTKYLESQVLIEKHHSGAGTAHNGLNYNSNENKNVAASCEDCKYADVQIAFKVKSFEGIKRIINIAEIVEYESEYDADYIKENGTSNDLWEGYKAEDVDSTPENHPEHDFEKAEDERIEQEKQNEEQQEETTGGKTTRPQYTTPDQTPSQEEGPYYREDDEDIAVIIPANFDLALEKWVSKVIRKDDNGEETERKYEDRNTQDNNVENREGDIIVRTGDTVVYTIRVYNQGNIDGYAEKIMDSNPDGLEFIAGNEINKKFGWEVGEDGKVYTTFLSKENGEKLKEDLAIQEENEEDEEITEDSEEITENEMTEEEKAFYEMYKDGTMLKRHDEWTLHIGKNFENGEYKPGSCENCDYKDIQIAFKVGKTVKENKESITRIVNLAEIVEDRTVVTEKNIVDGEEKEVLIEDLPDVDSTPDNYIGDFEEGRPREDDEDIAVIVPEIFDLALQKWITSYEITVEGQTSTVETTQNYDSTIDEKTGSKLVKIDLDAKKLDSTIIKVKYGIRVVNEGTIPGYVKELTDYIPAGTEFYAEDNKDAAGKAYWVLDGNNKIVTSVAYEDKMDTLMQPGDSQIFYVTLRWINNQENMGLKNNIVEISKDYNEWDVPDVDSDPGNAVDRLETKNWEDDEDEVPFLLTVKTGEWIIYFGVTFAVLLVALGVTIVIKKKAEQRI